MILYFIFTNIIIFIKHSQEVYIIFLVFLRIIRLSAMTLGQVLSSINVVLLNQEVGADNYSAFVVKKK